MALGRIPGSLAQVKPPFWTRELVPRGKFFLRSHPCSLCVYERGGERHKDVMFLLPTCHPLLFPAIGQHSYYFLQSPFLFICLLSSGSFLPLTPDLKHQRRDSSLLSSFLLCACLVFPFHSHPPSPELLGAGTPGCSSLCLSHQAPTWTQWP